MKHILIPVIFTTALAGASFGASAFDFNTEGLNDKVRGGEVSGWIQNVANPVYNSIEYPIAYTSDVQFTASGPVSRGLYLGTMKYGLEPNAPDVVITGDMSDAGLIAGTTLALNLAITANTNLPLDGFGVTVVGSSGDLVSLEFEPTASNTWNIGYSSSGGSFTPTASTFVADSGYVLFFEFLESSMRIVYGTAESGVGTNVIAEIATGSGTQTYQGLEFLLDRSAGTNSYNALIADNIRIIPEPSAALLIGVTALAGFVRRRR